MDRVLAKKNVLVSIICKIITLILAILSKRYLISYGGVEVNGLFSLYSTIINFLSVVDIGMGTAISFCMYEPIVKNNTEKVSALYCLFKKIYTILGIIVTVLGLAIIPLLPYLAKAYTVDLSTVLSYVLFLAGAVISYFYAAKLSLINAYRNNYLTTLYTAIGTILQSVVQIIIIKYTGSFVAFSAAKIISTAVPFLFFIFNKKYNNITKTKAKLDNNTKAEVQKNIRAMCFHKIGDIIFASVDSLVISALISVVVLGYYSNYLLIITSMTEVTKLFIIPLTSMIGNMNVESTNEEKIKYFRLFYSINFILGSVFYLGYYSVAHSLVEILLGSGLRIDDKLLMLLSLTYFIQFMRQSTSVFKDSFGLFYKDRFVAIIAAIINVVLSFLLAYFIGIYGVLLATIIVDVLIYHIIEPHILFKYGFSKKTSSYYFLNYFIMLFFIAEVFLLDFISVNFDNVWINLFVNAALSIAINIIPIIVICIINPDIYTNLRNRFIRRNGCKKDTKQNKNNAYNDNDFLFVFTNRNLYYFEQIDKTKANILYTLDKKPNFILRVLRKINIKLIMKAEHLPFLYRFNCKICSLIYGKEIVNCITQDTGVAILDSAATIDILFIIKNSPSKNVFLIIWNAVDEKKIRLFKHYINLDNIYSYSKYDCDKYGLKRINEIYLIDYPKKELAIHYDFYFLGRNKNRLSLLSNFIELIKDDYKFKIDIFVGTDEIENNKNANFSYFREYLSYSEYLDNVFHSRCLLDFMTNNNITFRTIEAMTFHKKYITNNVDIVSYDFYNENNILVVNDKTTIEDIYKFMSKPFVEISRDILLQYDFYTIYNYFKELSKNNSNASLPMSTNDICVEGENT
ncbi:MAG: lipopolysaccharide biosynthesis protein [Bacilli bacterium]